MNELTKKKKKGFTLIELIAVIAIIGILAAVLVPRVVGYLNDAKRSKVVAQCRTFVMAVETYNGKETVSLTAAGADPSISDLSTAVGASSIVYTEYFDLTSLDSLDTSVLYSEAKVATDGRDSAGDIKIVDIDTMPWAGTFK